MTLPPVTLNSDSIEDLNLNADETPTIDTFDKSDDPRFDARDRSASPSSDAGETPATKEWPFLSFEKFVQNWLKSNDAADIFGNEDIIEEMFQDYKKDYELIKPILDTLIRFSVDNHETTHQIAHGMLNNLSLGHSLLTLNPAWLAREEVRKTEDSKKTKEAREKAEEEAAKKAEEERKKAEDESRARAKGAVDLLAKVDLTIAKAKADAKSKRKAKANSVGTSTADPADKKADGKTKSAAASTDRDPKITDDTEFNADIKAIKVEGKKKFNPYVPKYVLDVHHRKYCMNDTLVTRGSVGDPSIVSCLAASARQARARIFTRNAKDGARPRANMYQLSGIEIATDWHRKALAAVFGDLKNIEGSYPDGMEGLIAEVVEAMMWM